MTNICDKFCRDCYYVRGGHDGLMTCHYFEIANKSRRCPAGKNCTVKKTTKQVRAEKKAGKLEKTMRTAVCAICGKEFQTTDKKRKHCSHECVTEARKRAVKACRERKKLADGR